MPSRKDITIVGGGLAGLTLGIGLRQRGVPVTIFEAGRYPRHRVCGEFICGNGPKVLDRLGLTPLFQKAGAYWARTARFAAPPNESPIQRLPIPALCLSRFVMDALLAGEFERLGGDLHQESRSRLKPGDGVVHASGRRLQATEQGWRWFGLKVHATNVAMQADLEMHASPDGYVGVNRISSDEVNICGLFRSKPGQVTTDSPLEMLRGQPGSPLLERLQGARFDESSFCSVAGLSLKPHRAGSTDACCIGDALTMIPPVTGNGMSMAFEAAEIAIQPLTAYSGGELTWDDARKAIAHACDRAFSGRLAWSRILHHLMFSSILHNKFGAALLNSQLVWRLMFNHTR